MMNTKAKHIRNLSRNTGSNGFTLIELLLAIAMIGILTASALQIVRSSNTHKNLTLAVDQVRVAIRTAQSYALAIPKPSSLGANKHICGFGVRVQNATQFEVFYNQADTIEDCANDGAHAEFLRYSAQSSPVVGSAFVLPQEVQFSAADVSAGNNIFFKVPYGDVFDSTGVSLSTGSSLTFTIHRVGAPGDSKQVSVNAFGRIE